MSRAAQKCQHCRQAFQVRKAGQKFCTHRCRQAAYRQRNSPAHKRAKTPETSASVPSTCQHCGGTFWAKTRRASFCSTSCRTLHHRALKAAIPQALTSVYGVPFHLATDIIETQPVARVRTLLETAGYQYQHTHRAWLRA